MPCLLVVAYGVTALTDRRVRHGVVADRGRPSVSRRSIPNAFLTRTQAGQVASAVLARAHHGDVVAYCPDQLGPAVSRELGDRFDEVAFPRGEPPGDRELGRLRRHRRAREHEHVRRSSCCRGPDRERSIWYVWAPGYLNFGNDCQVIANDLAARRPQRDVVGEKASDTPFEIFEGESLYRYAPS